MKVVYTYAGRYPPIEGLGTFVEHLAKHLIERGGEPTLVLRGSQKASAKTREEWHGKVRVIKTPFAKIPPFHVHLHGLLVQPLVRRLEAETDLFHCHMPVSPPFRTRTPVVTTFHTPMGPDSRAVKAASLRDRLFKAQGAVVARLDRRLIRKSAAVTAVSPSMIAALSEYGLDPAQVDLTPNGVDTSRFRPDPKRQVPGRLLYTGRLAPRKGLPDLLQAVALLSKGRTDFQVVITGRGPYADMLKRRVAGMGIGAHVDFAGFVTRERLVELYQEAQMLVFPTYYEGLPTSVLEAMASGIPVASTTAPGVVDLVRPGENGLLCAPGDVPGFAENVDRLLSDPETGRAMGAQGRKDAVGLYDWRRVFERTYGVYERVLKDHKGAGSSARTAPES